VKTLFLGNLPFSASEEDVKNLFGQHGEVAKVSLITDRETGLPRGFGYVEMEPEAAAKAIDALDGCEFGGRTLRVNEARDRGSRPPRRSW
jgi:RNA recognition motif-containing protein